MQGWGNIRHTQNTDCGAVIPARLSTMMCADRELYSMIRQKVQLAALLAALAVTVSASAEEQVAEFMGSGNRNTAVFEVRAPWMLDWRINSDYNKMISFDLDLVDGTTGILQGNILQAKALGNGVRMFNTSGKYRFRINASFVRWHLKVIELTPEEAEAYTPRQPR